MATGTTFTLSKTSVQEIKLQTMMLEYSDTRLKMYRKLKSEIEKLPMTSLSSFQKESLEEMKNVLSQLDGLKDLVPQPSETDVERAVRLRRRHAGGHTGGRANSQQGREKAELEKTTKHVSMWFKDARIFCDLVELIDAEIEVLRGVSPKLDPCFQEELDKFFKDGVAHLSEQSSRIEAGR